MVFAGPPLSMSRTAKAREESPSPARSACDLKTYGFSPSSGERTPQLPGPTNLEDAVDFDTPNSEDEQPTTTKYAGRGTELHNHQTSPPRLPDVWTSLSVEAQAAIIQRWPVLPGLDAETTTQRSTPARADGVASELPSAVADDHPDAVAAEVALAAAGTLGATSVAAARRRVQALKAVEQEALATARPVSEATKASDTADSASKAAVAASEDAARSASRAQASIFRAREALQATRAGTAR